MCQSAFPALLVALAAAACGSPDDSVAADAGGDARPSPQPTGEITFIVVVDGDVPSPVTVMTHDDRGVLAWRADAGRGGTFTLPADAGYSVSVVSIDPINVAWHDVYTIFGVTPGVTYRHQVTHPGLPHGEVVVPVPANVTAPLVEIQVAGVSASVVGGGPATVTLLRSAAEVGVTPIVWAAYDVDGNPLGVSAAVIDARSPPTIAPDFATPASVTWSGGGDPRLDAVLRIDGDVAWLPGFDPTGSVRGRAHTMPSLGIEHWLMAELVEGDRVRYLVESFAAVPAIWGLGARPLRTPTVYELGVLPDNVRWYIDGGGGFDGYVIAGYAGRSGPDRGAMWSAIAPPDVTIAYWPALPADLDVYWTAPVAAVTAYDSDDLDGWAALSSSGEAWGPCPGSRVETSGRSAPLVPPDGAHPGAPCPGP